MFNFLLNVYLDVASGVLRTRLLAKNAGKMVAYRYRSTFYRLPSQEPDQA